MEENPFPELDIASSDFLDSLSGRSKCTKCQRSRKYYCYNCFIPVPEIKDKVPKIKLPLKVDIIKHPSEVDGKSTAVHAAVIAPDDVTVYTYPCIPDYEDKSKVLLVFPGETSITLTELAVKLKSENIHSDNSNDKKRKHSLVEYDVDGDCTAAKVKRSIEGEDREERNEGSDEVPDKRENAKTEVSESSRKQENEGATEEMPKCQSVESDQNKCVQSEDRLGFNSNIERVVFIDSTWNQTKTICGDERLKGIQCVELKSQETKFWRHQKDKPDTYLSTIEAIYYFLKEYHQQVLQSEYKGDYDNLLFFFTYMYRKIRTLYDGGNELKAYKNRSGK